jgi:phosphoenolpyruvate carboxylase
MLMFKIPKTMSTQHPDNAATPFFAESPVLSEDDEVQEAYYVFSHLNIEEQMWDCEGKEIDTYVVKKLLSRYPHYFENMVLGKDRFITLRIPNPSVEPEEAKFMVETLESIPRNYDTAKIFYRGDIAPIFEVILPMTTNAEEVMFVYEYYRRFVVGKENFSIGTDGRKLKDWIGEFNPKSINVIPLFETFESILSVDEVIKKLISNIPQKYFRVFIARSDPALNYGFIAAVLITHVALRKLQELEEKSSVPIYPIIGMGSAPFRGNLKPSTAERIANEYSFCHTFTIQSAFKFDYPVVDVVKAIEYLNSRERKKMADIDEKKAVELAKKTKEIYHRKIEEIAKPINAISLFVPRRRLRKLHIGLFGYTRSIGKVKLPRAISYCAAAYSLGFPPELIELGSLSKSELEFIFEVSPAAKKALKEAASYYNPQSAKIFGKLPKKVHSFIDDVIPNEYHNELTTQIIQKFKKGEKEGLEALIVEAAHVRRFLG